MTPNSTPQVATNSERRSLYLEANLISLWADHLAVLSGEPTSRATAVFLLAGVLSALFQGRSREGVLLSVQSIAENDAARSLAPLCPSELPSIYVESLRLIDPALAKAFVKHRSPAQSGPVHRKRPYASSKVQNGSQKPQRKRIAQ